MPPESHLYILTDDELSFGTTKQINKYICPYRLGHIIQIYTETQAACESVE